MKENIENAQRILRYSKSTLLPTHPDFTTITIADDTIYKNINGEDTSEVNLEVTDKIWDLINSNIDTIRELSDKEKNLDHFKDSHKDQISIRIMNQQYLLTNKVADEEIINFYTKITEEILKMLNS